MSRSCSARCSAVAVAHSPLFARAMMAQKDSMISSVFMVAYLPGSFRDHIEKDHRAHGCAGFRELFAVATR
jgi:hypothetical protein